MKTTTAHTLRLILGDQLNIRHSWFRQRDDAVLYVMMEIRSETDYAKHHVQKVAGFFAAMRCFADELRALGHIVKYIQLKDADNKQNFSENVLHVVQKHKIKRFEYQMPDEYRVDQELLRLTKSLQTDVAVVDSEHFYTSRYELAELFKGKKTAVMETFYRAMRKKHEVLVDHQLQPLFGKWNFDAENRKKLPAQHKPIAPLVFDNDVTQLEVLIREAGIQTIGELDARRFIWPINRAQALALLDYFCEHCLVLFGTFQDAMAPGEWSLYHSRLSFAMNLKLLSPREVVNKAIETYADNKDNIAYHQVEGFVRQIIGWREYMRGIYWWHMPAFASLNYFNHQAPLPDWFWTGKTKMKCLSETITQSLQHAYAHHIQRLMITGNFALLAGVHPDETDAWYLGIYIDALDWVEITNTRGMSQFADGGLVGTKPYVSSATYIHKMSSYCTGCFYDKDKKTGEGACPFNSLYWNFYDRHASKLANNPRIGMMYQVWKRMDSEQKAGLLSQAEKYLSNINEL